MRPPPDNMWNYFEEKQNAFVFKLIVSQGCHIASWTWVIIGSCNGLSPFQCQAITWTNADLLSFITNFSEIWIKNTNFDWRKYVQKCYLQNGILFVQVLMCWHIEAETNWPTFSDAFSWMKSVIFRSKFHRINNKASLVQIKASHRTGDKLLSEPLMA